MDYAVDKMKIERGIWKTGDDAAQIALMRARDVPRGYVVEERPPHWMLRRHANTIRDVQIDTDMYSAGHDRIAEMERYAVEER
jgi:hypothetical protein